MQTTHQLSNKNNILTQGPGVQETVNTQTFFFLKRKYFDYCAVSLCWNDSLPAFLIR